MSGGERVAAHYLETIEGHGVQLIPYSKEYVPLFHGWLQDPAMQQLVATPAVTLDADYIFQEECAHATDKMIKLIKVKSEDGAGPVIGDVDLFFFPEGEAEVNIMIASPEWRRHGHASEALTLAIQYAMQRLEVSKFVAKIGADNEASCKFFERHGFKRINEEPNVFGQLVYELDAGDVPSSNLHVHSSFEISP